MKHRALLLIPLAALTLCFTAQAQPNGGGGAGGGGAGGRGGFGGRGGGPGAAGLLGGRDAFAEAISVLGDANLAPDFNLTKEQKDKVKALRDDFKAKQEKWRQEHEAELKKLDDQMTELRASLGGGRGGQGGAQGGAQGGGAQGGAAAGGTREKFQEMMQQRQELMATAPSADDAVKELKAILTEDQAKTYEADATAHQAELDKQREALRNRFGGGGPGGPGGAGGRGGRGGQNGGGGNGGGGNNGGQTTKPPTGA